MSEQTNYTLSVNRKTGDLQVQPEMHQERSSVNQELGRVIEQQLQPMYFILILFIAILVSAVFIAIFKDDILLIICIIVLGIAIILGSIKFLHIHHLTIKYIMDTIYKMAKKPQNKHNIQFEENEDTDHGFDTTLTNNLVDNSRNKKNF